MNWYSFQFKFEFEQNTPPKWWLDILVIDTVVRDVMEKHKNDIGLWRFHRRADHDTSGHKLTLFCYTTEEVSIAIDEIARCHKSIVILKENSLLFDYTTGNSGSSVEGTSDPRWSIEVKKAWPYYIMGISQLILDLIDRIKNQQDPLDDGAGIDVIKRYYASINNRVIAIWQNEGGHAFLHHLNAMFGYTPILMQPADGKQALAFRF